MIDAKKATESLARMSLLKFFPADDYARAELVRFVGDMATTNEQVEWLTTRCLQLWNAWEGPKELRAIFCSKFKPADGVEAYSDLPQFVDGIPSERADYTTALPAPADAKKRLTAAECTTAPSVVDTLADLARATRMAPIIRPIPATRREGTITQEMIDAAVQENRDKKAREELGL